MPSIDAIVGLPHRPATRLRRAKVRTTESLLKRAADPEDRRHLAAATGLAEADLLAWCHRAELLSIDGIGGEYAHLLTTAGIATVPALAAADPDELVVRLTSTNGNGSVVRRLPTPSMVTRWVALARTTPTVVR